MWPVYSIATNLTGALHPDNTRHNNSSVGQNFGQLFKSEDGDSRLWGNFSTETRRNLETGEQTLQNEPDC